MVAVAAAVGVTRTARSARPVGSLACPHLLAVTESPFQDLFTLAPARFPVLLGEDPPPSMAKIEMAIDCI